MASGGVTTTGLADAKAASRRLPAAVTAALRGVARATALRVRTRAFRLIPKDTQITAQGLRVFSDPHEQQYVVQVGRALPHVEKAGRTRTAYLPELVIWLEYGTEKSRRPKSRAQRARPFMRPALKAEDAQYRRDMAAAAERAARETLGA